MARIRLLGLKYEYSSTTFDSFVRPSGYRNCQMWDIETKIVYIAKGHSTNNHLQSNGLYGMDQSFKQVNHYGNQSLSLIVLRNTAYAAHITVSYLLHECYLSVLQSNIDSHTL